MKVFRFKLANGFVLAISVGWSKHVLLRNVKARVCFARRVFPCMSLHDGWHKFRNGEIGR